MQKQLAAVADEDFAAPPQKGDRLEVVGEKDNLQRLAKSIGFVERDLDKTDLATFAFGMIAGSLLGLMLFMAGGVRKAGGGGRTGAGALRRVL